MYVDESIVASQQRVGQRTEQVRHVARLRTLLNFSPLLGVPLAIGLAFVHPLLGSVAVTLTTLLWLVGVYRVERKSEACDARLQAAEEHLEQLRAAQGNSSYGDAETSGEHVRAHRIPQAHHVPAAHKPL